MYFSQFAYNGVKQGLKLTLEVGQFTKFSATDYSGAMSLKF